MVNLLLVDYASGRDDPVGKLSPRVSLTPSRAPTTATTTQPIPTQPPATTGQTTTGEDDDDDRGRGAGRGRRRRQQRQWQRLERQRGRRLRYRQLGSSDLVVSEVSLGSWLTYGVGVDPERAQACVDKAFDVGISFIDTANVYGRGRAEDFLGEALAARPRDSYILATKPTSRCRRRTSVSRARAGGEADRRLAPPSENGTTSTSTSAIATTSARRSTRRWKR